ncbi:MAG TPA: non-canonical purine NTP pyrophosphatase, partial [Nitrososphaerales archaeon]|nr:non-canonical purine NTP pyrophosphatase [Nitrososphaerales archaeon]
TFERARKPLFVEDTGLFVSALNGFPGPYASYVNRTVGPESLITLMKGVRKRTAEFVSAVAFCSGPSEVRVFSGRLRGRIPEAAAGTNGFGFDPVFVPLGSELTLAEMSLEEKSKVSHRSLALRALGRWLESHHSR